MVRIQRFVLLLVLIGSVSLSGCANARSRLASLFGGPGSQFSDSIVDNRDLKSAKEMADDVQKSLTDKASDTVGETTKRVAERSRRAADDLLASSRKYTRANGKKIDSLDTQIDDVVARAKARGKKALSDFPEDPFLKEFDQVASVEKKTTEAIEKAEDSVFDRLEAAKEKMRQERDTFGDDDEVAEPLIAAATDVADKVDLDVSNPFADVSDEVTQVADEAVADFSSEFDEIMDSATDLTENTEDTLLTKVEDVSKEFETLPDFEFDKADLPIPEMPGLAGPTEEPVVEDLPSPTPTRVPVVTQVGNSQGLSEFDRMFADATDRSALPQQDRTYRDTRFRTASAQDDSVRPKTTRPAQIDVKTATQSKPVAVNDRFDRMIIDSDEIPRQPISKPTPAVSDDQFRQQRRDNTAYDDFFEADHSVRANEPGDVVTPKVDDLAFGLTERNDIVPHEPSNQFFEDTTPEVPSIERSSSPEQTSPFDEFDDLEELETIDEDIPVALAPIRRQQKRSQPPLHLVGRTTSDPAVVPVANNVSANTSAPIEVANPFAFEPAGVAQTTQVATNTADANPVFELVPDSADYKAGAPVSELPEIIPANTGFSAVETATRKVVTPLENVAWEVEPDPASIGPLSKKQSPWIAWIAVTLCSIALILLLRPATNRI